MSKAVAGADYRGAPPENTPGLHKETLYRIIAALPGSSTEQIQDVYESLAPVVYRGTTEAPLESRRYRRDVIDGLEAAEFVRSVAVGQQKIWCAEEGSPDA